MTNLNLLYFLSKLSAFLFILIFIVGCTSNAKQVSESCTFIKNSNDNFSLKVNSNSTTKTYENIERIGWTKNGVLILHPINNQLGWTYIFDAGDVTIKEWGHYSEKEFVKRSYELGILGYKTFAAVDAWNNE